MILDDLIRKFCPVIYLHPDERFMPSSVEWWFQRTRLTREGAILASPVQDWQDIADKKFNLDDKCHFELLSDDHRHGDISTAPVYVGLRAFMKDGVTKCYDISYWLFYPFNGNIFDAAKASAVLGGGAAGLALLGVLCPVVFATPAIAAIAAAAWLRENPQVSMHEGDWEHITVRTTADGELLAVMYNDHGDERWFYTGQTNSPYADRNYCSFEGTRPVVYSAINSHASYPYTGTTQRLGGFANDNTGQGIRIDALDESSPGYVVMNPDCKTPPEHNWVYFKGRWGRAADNPGPVIQWIGQQIGEALVAVNTGPGFSWISRGDGEPNKNWNSDPVYIAVDNKRLPASRILSAHTVLEHLYIFYLDNAGLSQAILFDGTYWELMPADYARMFGGCEDVEVFEMDGNAYAIAVSQQRLVFALQQNASGGKYQTLPWQPYSNVSKAIMNMRCVSPVGSACYYTTDGDKRPVALTVFLRSEVGYAQPILSILSFDGRKWEDISPGDYFPVIIDEDSPVDICVYDGKLVVALRGTDEKTYVLCSIPSSTGRGGLKIWDVLYVDDNNFSSISLTCSKQTLFMAAQKADDAAIYTCGIQGDPTKAQWALQVLPKSTAAAGSNIQLACISTSQSMYLLLNRKDTDGEFVAYYVMPT